MGKDQQIKAGHADICVCRTWGLVCAGFSMIPWTEHLCYVYGSKLSKEQAAGSHPFICQWHGGMSGVYMKSYVVFRFLLKELTLPW